MLTRDKNLSARGRLRRSAASNFYFGTPPFFETNAARKLKFGTLVVIYEYYGSTYKFVLCV